MISPGVFFLKSFFVNRRRPYLLKRRNHFFLLFYKIYLFRILKKLIIFLQFWDLQEIKKQKLLRIFLILKNSKFRFLCWIFRFSTNFLNSDFLFSTFEISKKFYKFRFLSSSLRFSKNYINFDFSFKLLRFSPNFINFDFCVKVWDLQEIL